MSNLKYVIVPTSEINSIDFNEVLQTSADTVRKSVDETLFLVKYDGDMPDSVSGISGITQEYNHSEFIEILSGDDWTQEIEDTTKVG